MFRKSLVLVLILCVTVISTQTRRAYAVPVMSLIPQENTAEVGYEFPVALYITGVEAPGAVAWQVTLKFDPSVLTVEDLDTDIVEGTWLKNFGAYPTYFQASSSPLGITVACMITEPNSGRTSSGTMATITFTVIGPGKSSLVLSDTLLLDAEIAPIDHTVVSGTFYTDQPKADFSYSFKDDDLRDSPVMGETITFNATYDPLTGSGSYDPNPDGEIIEYRWDFGDGTVIAYVLGENLTTTATHSYTPNGDYEVTLTVTDNNFDLGPFTHSSTRQLHVARRDIALTDLIITPSVAMPGTTVSVNITATNLGTEVEYFNVTLYYDNTMIYYNVTPGYIYRTAYCLALENGPEGRPPALPLLPSESLEISFRWDTTGLPEAQYTLRANASLIISAQKFDEFLQNAESNYANNEIQGIATVGAIYAYTRLYLPHEWVEDGVAMGWHADDNSWAYTLPFDFPFYGTYYRTIYISSNGLITFIGSDSSWGNSIEWLTSKLAIAAAWDDLATYAPRDIFIWQLDSTHVVIRWYASPLYNTTATVDFEAILGADGVIQLNYGYNDGSISATVGISNGVGDIIAEDITSSNNINTILFTPYRSEHDLSVHLQAPSNLPLGQPTILNATVDNLGSNDELGVELELRINDEIVSSEVIPELISGSSYTLSHEWTPTAEGSYNVTAYALPVPDEEYTGNNVASGNVTVFFMIARVAVLNSWDYPGYFTGGWANDYQPLVDALNAEGFYAQAVTNEEIIGGILSDFDVFAMVDNVPNEAAVPYVVAFWSNGGGVVAFDSSICFLNYAGILPPESAGSNGAYVYWDYDTSNQARISSAHPITAGYEVGQIVYGAGGDAEYRVDVLAGSSAYPYYAMLVEDVTRPNRAYVSAYEPPSSGNVVHIWDYSHWRNTNLQSMILNAMEWAKAPRYEHDLAVSQVVPPFLPLDHSTMLNATVRNRGLNNETNVELYILIDGAYVDSVLIPELLTASSYTLSYGWTPTIEGNYNITVYATPVPDEADITNNQATRFAAVVRPLIQPMEGQWANYSITSPYGQLLLNSTYSYYLTSAQMHVDLWFRDEYGNTWTDWLTLNIINRQVEAGLWAGYWYPLWIETDVTDGSTVDILWFTGTVTGSRFIEMGDFLVDCWRLEAQYYDTIYNFWFDKANGLVVAIDIGGYLENWRLTATNVPLNYMPRIRIQTTPQSGPVGTQVTVTGVNATPNGSVEIYWDNALTGIATADESGNFAFTLTVSPSTRGIYQISALDLTTNVDDTAVFTVVSSIAATPSFGPAGTKVQVSGLGFGAFEPLTLSFEDTVVCEVYTDNAGSFTVTFNIPLSQSGTYVIEARYENDYVQATYTVVDVDPLDVNIDVGSLYFKGETAEFYIQTSWKGRPIDVTSMSATIYTPDGTAKTVTYQRIARGLYRIQYTISGKGSMTGTYTLTVEAQALDDIMNAYGTSIRTFIVKSTWERETPKAAALSLASIGVISAMVLLWRKEKKQFS